MREMRAALDRLAKAAARRLLAWVARRVDSTQQTWLEALRAELDAIDGGIAQLVWAVGGLRLIWLDRRQHMVDRAYRYSPVLLIVLGAALFVGFTLSLMQYYVSIAEVLLVLTGLGLVVAVPVLIALMHVIRSMVTTRLAARNLEQQQEHLISYSLPMMIAFARSTCSSKAAIGHQTVLKRGA